MQKNSALRLHRFVHSCISLINDWLINWLIDRSIGSSFLLSILPCFIPSFPLFFLLFLDNNPPEITGPTEVEAFVGEPLVFTINASDPDNDPVILASDGLPEGATFNNISGLFNWTAQNITNLTLEFDATDSKGDAASWEVIVNLCKCRYRDQCDYDNYVGDSTGTLRVVGCNCSDQYTGDFCETEVDPCSDGPCYEGSNCTTKRNPFGFECSPCPDGLTGNGETCYGERESPPELFRSGIGFRLLACTYLFTYIFFACYFSAVCLFVCLLTSSFPSLCSILLRWFVLWRLIC